MTHGTVRKLSRNRPGESSSSATTDNYHSSISTNSPTSWRTEGRSDAAEIGTLRLRDSVEADKVCLS